MPDRIDLQQFAAALARLPLVRIAVVGAFAFCVVGAAVLTFSSTAGRQANGEAPAIPALVSAAPGEPSVFPQPLPQSDPLARRARDFGRDLHTGQAIGFIEIPAIGLDRRFFEGGASRTLIKGPVHYPRSPVPGEGGLVAIGGASAAAGAPFRRLGQLEAGDEATVRMPYGVVRYVLQSRTTVEEHDMSIFAPSNGDRLLLTRPEASGDPQRRNVLSFGTPAGR